MLQERLATALKEWAVTQRSLLEGHQIVLLRKGGLIEETGDFDLQRAAVFALSRPTNTRPSEQGTCSRASGSTRDETQDSPGSPTGKGHFTGQRRLSLRLLRRQFQQLCDGPPVAAGADCPQFRVEVSVGQFGVGDAIGEVQVDVAALNSKSVWGGAGGVKPGQFLREGRSARNMTCRVSADKPWAKKGLLWNASGKLLRAS